jgi:Tfp pilus assembly protein PilF
MPHGKTVAAFCGGVAFVALVLAILAQPVAAQVGTTIRVLVGDERGAPMPDVDVLIEFKGTPGVRPQTFRTKTNKKGFLVRVGLPPGDYKVTFSREGYQSFVVETALSLGGLSEIPDVVMKPAAVAGAPRAAAPAEGGSSEPRGDENIAAKIKEEYTKAYEAMSAGQYDAAERLYKDILAKAPGFATVHFNLGYVYRQKKDLGAAQEQFRAAIGLEPDKSDSYLALAGIHELMSQHDQALAVLEEAAPRFGQDATFQLALGIKRRDLGKPDAAAALEKARAIDPAAPEPYYHLATVAIAKNQTAEAIAGLEKYVSMTGQNPQNLEIAKGLLAALKKPR